jgi:hypothetical protein
MDILQAISLVERFSSCSTPFYGHHKAIFTIMTLPDGTIQLFYLDPAHRMCNGTFQTKPFLVSVHQCGHVKAITRSQPLWRKAIAALHDSDWRLSMMEDPSLLIYCYVSACHCKGHRMGPSAEEWYW